MKRICFSNVSMPYITKHTCLNSVEKVHRKTFVQLLYHLSTKFQEENTQFIVVSHHKSMIESASRTIGITQGKGITKVTGIKLSD